MRWTLGALVALGCAIEDEADYVASRADAECARLEVCALGYFEAEYADADDCAGERAEEIEQENEFFAEVECEFDAEQAGPCVSRIRGMSCEDVAEGEWQSACDLVWDCGDMQPYYYGYEYTVFTSTDRDSG